MDTKVFQAEAALRFSDSDAVRWLALRVAEAARDTLVSCDVVACKLELSLEHEAYADEK